MKRIWIFVIIFLLVQTIAFAETYYYKRFKEKSGTLVDTSKYKISDLGDGRIRYVWDNKNEHYWEITEYTMNEEGMCVIWHRINEAENTQYTVVNDGKKLTIAGELNGKKIDKVITYKKYPFYANPKIELMDFIRSGADTTEFWVLRRDTLTEYKMIARNKGIRTVVVNGQMVDAYLIEWGPSLGMISKYFGRKYWFRETDLIFVKQTGSNRYVRELAEKIS